MTAWSSPSARERPSWLLLRPGAGWSACVARAPRPWHVRDQGPGAEVPRPKDGVVASAVVGPPEACGHVRDQEPGAEVPRRLASVSLDAQVEAAIEALLAGGVVVLPTDTVYGVAAATSVPGAVAALFEVKRRPVDVALPVLCANEQSARALAGVLSPGADRLMARCWPGPLTIVVPRRAGLDLDLGGADDTTIGLRVPDADVFRAVAARVGPLACTSANRHGRPTPTTASEAAAALGPGISVVVDGGTLSGSPSTVVGWSGGRHRILRQGALSAAAVEAALGHP